MTTFDQLTLPSANAPQPVQQKKQSDRGYGMEMVTMRVVKEQSKAMLLQRRLPACALGLAAMVLTGCGAGLSTSDANVQVTGHGVISGNVHGGQQPVVGATIQLYAVGTTGLKSAAAPLIGSTVVTNSSGVFSISGLYSCTGATQVYLTATGGSSGGAANSAIALMAPLGSCSTLLANAATTFVQINELTTVASAYALAPFMSNYTHIGATGSNPTGLVNAVANFNNLVNLSTGFTGGASLPAGATVPATQLNTLANIISACVNTSSSTSTPCTTLFTATSATDTTGAALAFANTPGSPALISLFSLSTSNPPFLPALSAAPTDWTVAIKYNAGGTMLTPYGIAIDASGNVWITNLGGSAVTKLTSTGSLVSNYAATGLIGAKGIAIDRTGNVWVANTPMNDVIEFNSLGVVQSGAGFTGGGLNGPVSIAMDSGGHAWIANLAGNSVTELSATGTVLQTGLTASSTISGPTGIALDASGNVYVANSGNGNVVKLTNAGAVASGSPFSDVALQGTTSVALDSSGNFWATGSTTGSAVAGAVSQFSSSGTPASYSPLTSGGLALPVGSATSGTSLWVTNGGTSGSFSELQLSQSAPFSPAVGFGSLNAPVGVAVDPSGDVWTANSGDNTVSVFIGLTSPVTTPIAANVGP